jgi:UDP-3-O-[3-hydroxymyristoyl] N-acetylglucosamine deacetylase/3-hydroxyacyl-[acyl-carrier-protein] dehydratase
LRIPQKIKLMSDMQKTLQEEVTLSGIGLHTGKEVKLTIKPAKENTGFVFVRTDLEGHPQVEADVNYVVATERGTTLEKLGVKITTCEHLLAALVGCDVDNAILEMDASEPPILDGSSNSLLRLLKALGLLNKILRENTLLLKKFLPTAILRRDPRSLLSLRIPTKLLPW